MILDRDRIDQSFRGNITNHYTCKDGKYLPSWHWVCDGIDDCIDGDDESACARNVSAFENLGKYFRSSIIIFN